MAKAGKVLYIFAALIMIFLFVYTILALAFSQFAFNSDTQKEFISGQSPTSINGSFKSASGNPAGWVGMKFDAAKKSGTNLYLDGTNTIDLDPFVVFVDRGIQDPDKTVMRIDYNIDANPIYMRIFQSELVQTAPGKYLGKMHLRIIPFIPFVLGFFRLEQ